MMIASSLVIVGCTEDEPEVPEIPTTPAQSGETPTTPATSPGAEPTGVPELCSELIRTRDVARIVETPMPGGVRRIYNDEFLESSGRTGRLTCEYGLPEEGESPSPSADEAGPVLSIAVSSYTDAEVAAGRIDMTVGATSSQVEAQAVAGQEGFFLRDDEDITLVFADGILTYVVSLVRDFVPEPAEPVVLLAIANQLVGEPSPTSTE